MPITQVEKIWMDGELVDWADAKIHVLSHALHYGTGVFEGIRAYETARGPAVWHIDEHLRRLYRSAKLYHLEIPFSVDAIGEGMKDVIRANGLRSCYVRPLVIRGYGEMGVNPLNAPVNVIIAVWPWGAYLGEDALEQGVRIKISSWRRNGQNSLPAAAKATGQYINSVLAKVGVAEGRLRRGHHAERAGLHHRRLGRERVHRPRRRPDARRRRRPAAWTASPAAA